MNFGARLGKQRRMSDNSAMSFSVPPFFFLTTAASIDQRENRESLGDVGKRAVCKKD